MCEGLDWCEAGDDDTGGAVLGLGSKLYGQCWQLGERGVGILYLV